MNTWEMESALERLRDRDNAILWARETLTRQDVIYFDTETTGIKAAEIVQVGLLHPDGTVALDSLVRPLVPIPAAATAIHGITDTDVAGAPELEEILEDMARHMHGREVVVYNKGYDQGTLYGCLRRREWEGVTSDYFADLWIGRSTWTCAMEPYSAFVGEWNGYFQSYKWQKLPAAGHTAIQDCQATLALIRGMAGTKTSGETDISTDPKPARPEGLDL